MLPQSDGGGLSYKPQALVAELRAGKSHGEVLKKVLPLEACFPVLTRALGLVLLQGCSFWQIYTVILSLNLYVKCYLFLKKETK